MDKQQLVVPKITTTPHTYLHKKTLIIGQRMTGKTSLIIYEIYRQLQYIIDSLYVVVPSLDNHEYDGITTKLYQPQDLTNIVTHIKHNGTHQSLIIFDDCPPHETIHELLPDEHIHNLTIVISALNQPVFVPAIRSQIDNVIVAPVTDEGSLSELFHGYFGCQTPGQFSDSMRCIQSGPFLFLYRCNDNKIGWYRADI
jgi:hypothetical protein